MKKITIHPIDGFEAWRQASRICLNEQIHPRYIIWNAGSGEQTDLFDVQNTSPEPMMMVPEKQHKVPKAFIDMAETACCHSDPYKYALLYRVLWRLTYENPNLLHLVTDNDVMELRSHVKAVYRDSYKITAYLRFRQITYDGHEHFVAWYQPEHYTLERVLPFFQTRFRNMRWSILMPYRAAHWDGGCITLEDNPNPNLYPKDDQVEGYWLKYYASIFNPARVKKLAMMTQMPKKYWKNMPETALIPELLHHSHERAQKMISKSLQKGYSS